MNNMTLKELLQKYWFQGSMKCFCGSWIIHSECCSREKHLPRYNRQLFNDLVEAQSKWVLKPTHILRKIDNILSNTKCILCWKATSWNHIVMSLKKIKALLWRLGGIDIDPKTLKLKPKEVWADSDRVKQWIRCPKCDHSYFHQIDNFDFEQLTTEDEKRNWIRMKNYRLLWAQFGEIEKILKDAYTEYYHSWLLNESQEDGDFEGFLAILNDYLFLEREITLFNDMIKKWFNTQIWSKYGYVNIEMTIAKAGIKFHKNNSNILDWWFFYYHLEPVWWELRYLVSYALTNTQQWQKLCEDNIEAMTSDKTKTENLFWFIEHLIWADLMAVTKDTLTWKVKICINKNAFIKD